MKPRRWCAPTPFGDHGNMKKSIKALDKCDLQQKYPLADLVGDWYFRCDEISAGCYKVEGIDIWGRTVSVTGIDPDSLLKKCIVDAKAINSQTT